MARTPERPCLCPSFGTHRPGCDAETPPEVRAAAERVRAKLAAGRYGKLDPSVLADMAAAATPGVLVTEFGPLAPNQLLHSLQADIEDTDVLVVVRRDRTGVWRTSWSDAKPGELLEAAKACALDCEVAWAETQDQLDGAVSPDAERD